MPPAAGRPPCVLRSCTLPCPAPAKPCLTRTLHRALPPFFPAVPPSAYQAGLFRVMQAEMQRSAAEQVGGARGQSGTLPAFNSLRWPSCLCRLASSSPPARDVFRTRKPLVPAAAVLLDPLTCCICVPAGRRRARQPEGHHQRAHGDAQHLQPPAHQVGCVKYSSNESINHPRGHPTVEPLVMGSARKRQGSSLRPASPSTSPSTTLTTLAILAPIPL